MNYLDPGPIPAFLDRTRLIYTYTNLNTFDNVCPHQFYRRYIVKDIPYVETDAMRWGNQVHTAFEHRLAGGKPLPVEMQQWEHFAEPFDNRTVKVEIKLAIDSNGASVGYWDKAAWLRGKIDAVVLNETGAVIIDWKTGGSKYEDALELEISALLLRSKYPRLERIMGRYVWLKEDRLGQSYDLSNTHATLERVKAIVTKIEQERRVGEFEKRRSGLCGWCDVLDCENNKKRV